MPVTTAGPSTTPAPPDPGQGRVPGIEGDPGRPPGGETGAALLRRSRPPCQIEVLAGTQAAPAGTTAGTGTATQAGRLSVTVR